MPISMSCFAVATSPSAGCLGRRTRAGFGPIVDLRAVGKAAGRYVSKYLGKEMGKTPEARRRAPAEVAPPRDLVARLGTGVHRPRQGIARALVAYAWYLANARPALIADRCSLGYEIDTSTTASSPRTTSLGAASPGAPTSCAHH